MTAADYFASLPDGTRRQLQRAAKKYLGSDDIPDKATAIRLLRELEMHTALLEVQIEFLSTARDHVLSQGKPWNHTELRRYVTEGNQP